MADAGADAPADAGGDPDAGGDAADGSPDAAEDPLPEVSADDATDTQDAERPHVIQDGTPCFLSDEAVLLVVEVATDLFNGAAWVIAHSEPREATHSLALIGGDRIWAASAFMIAECTEASAFEPYCTETFEDPSEWTCSRLGCEAAGIITIDAWFAEDGHTGQDDQHVFSYDTTRPPGTATYEPNPYQAWRIDVTQELATAASTIDAAVTVAVTGGDTYDLTHVGAVSAAQVSDAHNTIEVDVSFPNLDGQGEDIGLNVVLGDDDVVSGTLSRGDVVIGDIGSTTIDDEPVPTLTWTCPE